jgi:ribosomal protein S18 acetylase RimI-like enzyme
MPVQKLRRIGPAVGESLYDRIKAQTLHNADRRPIVDAIERDHADLIVEDGSNILAAEAWGEGLARLNYGFDDARAFSERFPRMFEKLVPRIRRVLRADTVRLRLTYAPARPLVEPVLRRLWFRPSRDWMEFSLARSAKLAAAPSPRGVRFRDRTAADTERLLEIDRASFPDTPIPASAFAARLKLERVIVAERSGEIAGFCMFNAPEPGAGWISVLAVAEEHRDGGLGAALTVRAAKQLFAGGAQEVGLTTDDDNGAAIRLYVRLGFKQTHAGRDYTRPTDPREIKAMKQAGEGTLIRFGGWR